MPPLPLLFILIMKGLNRMLRVASQNRWIRRFEVSSRIGVNYGDLPNMFADAIFRETKEDQISYVRAILVSGQRVD